ncbi:mCG1036034, isoform CRA_b, partial [Mus musculus]
LLLLKKKRDKDELRLFWRRGRGTYKSTTQDQFCNSTTSLVQASIAPKLKPSETTRNPLPTWTISLAS